MPLAPTTPKNPAYCALLTTFIPVIGKPPPSKIPQKVRLLSIPLPIGSHRCAERSIGAVIRMICWRLEESPGFRFSKKLALPLLCAPPFSDTYVSPALCEDSCLWPFSHLQQLPSKSFSRRAPPARRTRLMNKWVLFIRCPFVISFFYREPAPEILFEVAERHYVSIFSRFCIRRDSAILMAVDCHFEFFHIFKWRSSAKSHKSVIIKLR